MKENDNSTHRLFMRIVKCKLVVDQGQQDNYYYQEKDNRNGEVGQLTH